MNDPELLKLLSQKGSSALEALMSRYGPLVGRFGPQHGLEPGQKPAPQRAVPASFGHHG